MAAEGGAVRKQSGFTLIELMVAMVISLLAVSSIYSLGAAMSKQFYEEQRVATSQGTSRVAIMELRRDISRAGLFGSPNGTLEPTCDAAPPSLPRLTGGTGPLGAFQYYPDYDLTTTLDPQGQNPGVSADRLRVLTSLYLTDQLLLDSASTTGDVVVIQSGNQAYRRTFAWGQAAGDFTSGSEPSYLNGQLGWDAAWESQAASWNGVSQKGARAFQTGSLLHISTPEGRHFFRSVFGRTGNTQDEVRITINPALPIGTACLPGAAEGSTVAPLQWVEYAVIDPFNQAEAGAEFFNFDGMFFIDLDPSSPSFNLKNTTANDLREAPNLILVRRILDANTGDVQPNTTQVVAEFVTNFRVSFLFDDQGGTTNPPSLSTAPLTGQDATSGTTDVNQNPENVRAIIIELGIRNPLEDPSVNFVQTDPRNPTRFDVDDAQRGSARVRNMRIEIPIMNIARRNL
jgi:prepilin-type N-terminal cleavage/methylation domain-containing protein